VKKRGKTSIICLAVALPVIGLAAATYWYSRDTRQGDLSLWHQSVGGRPELLSVAQRRIVVGMGCEDVIRLLGSPERRLRAREVYQPPAGARWLLYYEMPPRSLMYDSRYFVIAIDANDRVIVTFVFEN
jgi:hypothetical protein